MADFLQAVEVVLRHEGGLSHSPHDPGGTTHWGISLRWARQELGPAWTIEVIENLKRDEAIEIYKVFWWRFLNLGAVRSQTVATKILDVCVNMGCPRGVVLTQEACRGCGASLLVDGVLGTETLTAINSCDPIELLQSIAARTVVLYQQYTAYPHFKKSWLRRAWWPWKNMILIDGGIT